MIEDFTDNKTGDDFLEDIQLQDATIRRIEIIGEASKNIPRRSKDDIRMYHRVKWQEQEIS